MLVAAPGDAAADSEPSPADEPAAKPALTRAGDGPIIELYTFGVGRLIWEKWGHGAICVRYRQRARDRCYNFGATDFSDGVGVMWGFLRGDAEFWVALDRPEKMVRLYRNKDRNIWVQRIPMPQDKAEAMAAKLANDAKPENKYYKYDHFYDNCTTRLRDYIDEAVGGKLSQAKNKVLPRTMRQMGREGLAEVPALKIIGDLFAARTLDKNPTEWEAMFLPDYLREAVANQLGVEPVQIHEREGPPFPRTGSSGRFMFFLLIVALSIPALVTRLLRRFQRVGLAVTMLLPTITGLLVWGVVLLSAVPELTRNETFWVLVPLDALVVFLRRPLRVTYARARVVMLCLIALLLVFGVFTQPLWLAMLWAVIPMLIVAFPAPARRYCGWGDRHRDAVRAAKAEARAVAESAVVPSVVADGSGAAELPLTAGDGDEEE